jgi:hypothetical protein
MRPGDGRDGRRRRHRRLSVPGFLLLLGLVLVAGMVKLAGPFSAVRREEQNLARLRVEQREQAAEQARLLEYKNHLATDAGMEAAARREGYVRAGERRIVFVPAESEEAEGAEETAAPPTE